ncbi:MAG: hypothetical protein HQK51_04470 [Oligoflexia bacterium]|nr:hypothetical protein [Oligoflexia bacterium]
MKISSKVTGLLALMALLLTVGCKNNGVPTTNDTKVDGSSSVTTASTVDQNSNSDKNSEIDNEGGKKESKWVSGMGPSRGHEDLERFAIAMANKMINEKSLNQKYLLPEAVDGDSGRSTKNPLVKGNYSTDWPNDDMLERYGYGVSKNTRAYQDDPKLMHNHGLRDIINGSALSTKEACTSIKNAIIKNTKYALSFAGKDNSKLLFWLGHVNHIIQDTFAPPHAVRKENDPHRFVDICTYGTKVKGVCEHGSPIDLDDVIWMTSFSCSLTFKRPFECLTDLAKVAVNATAGHLIATTEIMQEIESSRNITKEQKNRIVEDRLEQYFELDIDDFNGYFDCSTL